MGARVRAYATQGGCGISAPGIRHVAPGSVCSSGGCGSEGAWAHGSEYQGVCNTWWVREFSSRDAGAWLQGCAAQGVNSSGCEIHHHTTLLHFRKVTGVVLVREGVAQGQCGWKEGGHRECASGWRRRWSNDVFRSYPQMYEVI